MIFNVGFPSTRFCTPSSGITLNFSLGTGLKSGVGVGVTPVPPGTIVFSFVPTRTTLFTGCFVTSSFTFVLVFSTSFPSLNLAL